MMEIQQMYQIAYILWGIMIVMAFVAFTYGMNQKVEKAYRFTRKYKYVKRDIRQQDMQIDNQIEESEETVLLEQGEETQILLQDETFYGNSTYERDKNVLNTTK